jgi:hypothetical protein
VHHQGSIDKDYKIGKDHFIIDEPNNNNNNNNNNNYHQQEYDNDNEDEENPPHVPTGSSSYAFQLKLIRREIMEAKSTAVKAIKIAIEAKKETKQTIKVLEATKEELNDLTSRLVGNHFSNNNNNNMLGEEHNSNGNRNAPQFRTIDPLPNDDRQSQTASLSADTYTLMMTKEAFCRSWFFGLTIFGIQITLLGLICHDQVKSSQGSSIFNIPFKVSSDVRISQFLAIFLSIMISYDIFMPIKELSMLWIANREWAKVVDAFETTDYHSLREIQDAGFVGRPLTQRRRIWLLHILLPLLLKFVQGVLVLLITFVIVIQSDDIIDLFKDFAAMQVISEIDNIAFGLATHGFFGYILKRDSDKAKEVKVKDDVRKVCFGLPLRPVVMVSLLITMMVTFVVLVIIGQVNGIHFSRQYPNCGVKGPEQIAMINDGYCNGGLHNTFSCSFDGGDCYDFNIEFPDCKALNAYEVGDGTCQDEHNIAECGYDGGDCCRKRLKDPTFLGDGNCNGGLYNTVDCAYDSGDCDLFRKNHPFCPDLDLQEDLYKDDGSPIALGDGVCDFIPEYMTKECGYENGDCIDCQVPDPSRLGNGICDGGLYNTKECGFDVGDCDKCNSIIDDYSRVGDGVCDSGQYNTDECNWDGGDCFCMNEAANGECDKNPSKMLVECEAACKISPLLLVSHRWAFLFSLHLFPILLLTPL